MFVECRHIKPSGRKCKSPALRSTSFCFFHTGLYHSRKHAETGVNQPIALPSLEDFKGVQIALHQVLGALSSSRIDPQRASLFLRGLRLAAGLASKFDFDSPSKLVRDVTRDDNGNSLASERTICEPPEDCLTCPDREECAIFEDHKDVVAELEKSAEIERSQASS